MARVKSPLFSLDASGTIGKAIVYSQWKGRAYVREHITPFNPRTETQVNVRVAFSLLVVFWQATIPAGKIVWNEFAKQFEMSGFNVLMRRGMKEYILQLTSGVTPTGVTMTGTPPTETWTWS